MGPPFVETLPVARFHGVGPATTAKMKSLGIETGADLKAQPLALLQRHFGKAGSYYYWIARGIDERPVRANRARKSIGAENTFFDDLTEFDAMRAALQPILDKLWRHCESAGLRGRTVTLKVKFADFQILTRSRSAAEAVHTRGDLETMSCELLRPLLPTAKGVRLLGVTSVKSARRRRRKHQPVDPALRRLAGGWYAVLAGASSLRSPRTSSNMSDRPQTPDKAARRRLHLAAIVPQRGRRRDILQAKRNGSI